MTKLDSIQLSDALLAAGSRIGPVTGYHQLPSADGVPIGVLEFRPHEPAGRCRARPFDGACKVLLEQYRLARGGQLSHSVWCRECEAWHVHDYGPLDTLLGPDARVGPGVPWPFGPDREPMPASIPEEPRL